MIFKRIDSRKQIINLLRGFYFLPIFINLHKSNILNKFSENKYIGLSQIKIENKFFLKSILDYLVSINLLKKKKEKYKFSKTGTMISKRIGTMYILNSYKKIINDFPKNLKYPIIKKNICMRKDNVIGSGLIHSKKFFQPSLDLINLKKVNNILDIGCGDGTFLNTVKKANSKINILGCDLSIVSINQTRSRLLFEGKKKHNIFQSNGNDILSIKKKLKKNKIKLDKNSVISLWFLLHEISDNSPKIIENYLRKIRKNFPETPLIIGEISRLNDKTLKSHNSISIMPEFMLFHTLSGQGLLSEKQYMDIFKNSSYKLKKIIRTDRIKMNNTTSSSNFICLIEPLQN